MERLTKRDEFGNADIIGVDGEDLQLNLGFEKFNKVTNALNKLAEYEELEEQGKLLKLPCAVGDTVYAIYGRKWCKDEKDYIGGNVICVNCHIECKGRMEYFIEEIPATLAYIANIVWHKEHPSDTFRVFCTKKEAEAALRKIQR